MAHLTLVDGRLGGLILERAAALQHDLVGQRIAERASSRSDAAGSQPVRECFQLLLNRQPSAEELQICNQVARQESLAIVCRALINSNEFVFLP